MAVRLVRFNEWLAGLGRGAPKDAPAPEAELRLVHRPWCRIRSVPLDCDEATDHPHLPGVRVDLDENAGVDGGDAVSGGHDQCVFDRKLELDSTPWMAMRTAHHEFNGTLLSNGES